ncbi:hypothetical protein K488DRAFT_50105 [Vararia minispora EC-137]|uniref:Uncharacterized protein n=1 Tax=Vararia minispora EC-137 TaxID=1314806 RepID=A0ACB8QKI0_9AGAM|nr:hypothetical protein K488DRAFT_50105 [Vararia minispora EC-137]
MSTLQDIPRLVPRKYQEEIFLQAMQGNVVAALDTGSGKTYIAALLIRWIASKPSLSTTKKKIVFIVPKIALVLQQADYIERHTPLRVMPIHGGIARSAEEHEKWAAALKKADVLVVTAQIFVNLITHSHWSLSQVSLLVMDECHHARKNHPYNIIMKEYFHCPISERPKVFGMTASPTWRTSNPLESLAELERNMDARIFTVRHHIDELNAHAPKPVEETCTYDVPPDTYPSYTIPSQWMFFGIDGIRTYVDIPWDKIRVRYIAALANLGIFGAEMYLHAELRARIEAHLESATNDEIKSLRLRFLDGVVLEGRRANNIDSSILALHDALEDYAAFFDFLYEGTDLSGPWKFTLSWCTPKVVKLVELLLSRADTIRGIIFVEQRHIAVHLSRILNRVPQLYGRTRASAIVGVGDNEGIGAGMVASKQHAVMRDFRDGKWVPHLVIATNVAEEGLDIPACDLVVRFDSLQHMVGYIQSRGRARQTMSRFIVMVQENDTVDFARYRKLSEAEPEIKQLYGCRVAVATPVDEGTSNIEDDATPVDLAERERFVVPKTGSILTYNNAISLLDRLCALIPRDAYMEVPKPAFSGDFEATLRLPISLPLDAMDRIYHGPRKQTKREARRAVAFRAVRRLYDLEVFDSYLLPTRGMRWGEDIDGQPIPDVSAVPIIINAVVRNPWTLGPSLWSHSVYVGGRLVAGIVTGTMLPPVELVCDGLLHYTSPGVRVAFDEAGEWQQRKLLQQYTDISLWWCNTGRPRPQPLTSFLVPVSADHQPDFDAMEQLLRARLGSFEWEPVTTAHENRLLMRTRFEFGRTYLFHRMRWDLTPLSEPPPDAREAGYATFFDYYRPRWERRGVVPDIPRDGPLVEAYLVHKQTLGSIDLNSNGASASNPSFIDEQPFLLPLRACSWFSLPEDIFTLYRTFPRLLRRITGVFRARLARRELGLPAIEDNLLVEAFTIPNTSASFNNQRLETLGDLVLKVCTSVHLFNRYPHRHEGQLERLRQVCVRNTTLLAHAKQTGLEEFLSCEGQNVKSWPYVTAEGSPSSQGETFDRRARRRLPRRSLQDCMEACLGASWLSGGIEMALRAGTALGLSFGGVVPWPMRYSRRPEPVATPPIFSDLQAKLGYEFCRPEPLLEALTHPTFMQDGFSYQRLEFLGDALIDLPMVTYLYHKFPKATSAQLANMREHVACAPVLAWIAVTKFQLHKLLLVNNAALSAEISNYVPILEGLSCTDIVQKSWAYDPPKVLSDVLESVVAAVLVDCGYNIEKTNAIVEGILNEVLEELYPELERDPVSQLMVWTAQAGCVRMLFHKSRSRPNTERYDSICVVVHDQSVSEMVTASSLSIAKAFASANALVRLRDRSSDRCLAKLCNCQVLRECGTRPMDVFGAVKIAGALPDLSAALASSQVASETVLSLACNPADVGSAGDSEEETLDDSTEAGFAAIARQKLSVLAGLSPETNHDVNDDEDSDLEGDCTSGSQGDGLCESADADADAEAASS